MPPIASTLTGSGYEVQLVSALPTFTWAGKPSASAVPTGTVIRVSDVGVGPGMRMVSDGTRWIPDGQQVLARSAAAAALTGSTSKTAQATVVVPAGLLGVNGSLRISAFWTIPSNANNKTLSIEYGGTVLRTATRTTSVNNEFQALMQNRNSASSQFFMAMVDAAAASTGTGTVDSSAAQNLIFYGQLGVGTDTATLEHYLVEVLP